MSKRFRILLAILLLPALACQAVTRIMIPADLTPVAVLPSPTALSPVQALASPTASPSPSPTLPPTATITPEPSPTPIPTTRPTPSALQLSVFEELWRIVKDEYLYEDFNGLDWDAVGEEYRQRVQAGLTDEEFYLAMDEMIYRLGDEHSIFLSPEQAAADDAEFAGDYDYAGIGVMTTLIPERERVSIILVFPGSPAEEAGLQIHDNILKADGQPVVDELGFRYDLLRGEEGSQVTLTVQSPGGEQREVTLTRRRISGSTPVPYQLLVTPDGARVGYILLTTFYDVTVADQVRNAIEMMSAEGPLDGIIIDNRQNSGGASDVVADTLAYFTSGVVGYFVNRHDEAALRVLGADIQGSQDVPLVVLVGPDSVSFGEITAGVLQDLGRAYLIGETTLGNVEVLYVYEFEDGSRALIAHDTFRPVNNREVNWEETGIVPDLVIPVDWDEVTIDTDPAVQAALNYLDSQ